MSVLPAGTLSGAPKVRAMEIIDELENKKRGVYGGTVGYLGFDGNIDTCIAIRTVVFKDGKDMCRQEQESSMTLFQRKNLWRQRIKH